MSDLVRLIDFHLKKNFEFYFKDISIWIWMSENGRQTRDNVFRLLHCFVLLFFRPSQCVVQLVKRILFWNWQYSLCFFWVWLPAQSAVCSLTQLLPKKTSWMLSRNGVQTLLKCGAVHLVESQAVSKMTAISCGVCVVGWTQCSCTDPLSPDPLGTHKGVSGYSCFISTNFDSYCPCLLSAILTKFHEFVVW